MAPALRVPWSEKVNLFFLYIEHIREFHTLSSCNPTSIVVLIKKLSFQMQNILGNVLNASRQLLKNSLI